MKLAIKTAVIFVSVLCVGTLYYVSHDQESSTEVLSRNTDSPGSTLNRAQSEVSRTGTASRTDANTETRAEDPDGSQVNNTALQKMVDLVPGDLSAAVDFFEHSIPRAQRRDAAERLAWLVCNRTLDEFPRLLAMVKGDDCRQYILSSVSHLWASKSAKTLFDFAARRLDGLNKSYVMGAAVNRLVLSKDYRQAGEMIDLMPFSASRSTVVRDLVTHWAADAPKEVYQWVRSLTLPEDRQIALERLIPKLGAVGDTENLVGIINDSQAPQVRKLALAEIVKSLIKGGDDVFAGEWISRLPADMKDSAVTEIIKLRGGSDIDKWGTIAVAMTDQSARVSALSGLTVSAFKQGPTVATKWLNRLPPDARRPAIGTLVFEWYDTDSIALSEWVNSLPSGQDKDYALEKLATRVQGSDQQAAIQLASQIGDRDTRRRVESSLSRGQR